MDRAALESVLVGDFDLCFLLGQWEELAKLPYTNRDFLLQLEYQIGARLVHLLRREG